VDLGIDQAGPHRVDPNAAADNFSGKPQRCGVERALRCRIIDEGAGRPGQRAERRDVHDRAALAAVACRHALHGFARAQQLPGDIDAHCFHDARKRQRLDAPLGAAGDAGIVHEPGERAKHTIRLGEESQHVVLAADIALHRDSVAAR